MKRPAKAKPITPAPSLFEQPRRDQSVKAIADRAEKTSLARRSMAEATRVHAAPVDLKGLPDPTTAEEYGTHFNQWLAGLNDHRAIRKRWSQEQILRMACNPEPKQLRLMAAAMDGRCRRLGEK